MSYGLVSKFFECLRKTPEQKLTAREIAKWITDNYPEECREKQKRSSVINSDKDLLNQIAKEIVSHAPRLLKKNPRFKATEGPPRKYHYTKPSDGDEASYPQDIASDPAKAATTSSTAANLNNKTLERLRKTPEQKFTAREIADECLRKNPEQKFTAREIAEWALNNYEKECQNKKNRSSVINSDEALLRRISVEIRAQTPRLLEKNSGIKVTKDLPRKYYYTESSDGDEAGHSQDTASDPAEAAATFGATAAERAKKPPEDALNAATASSSTGIKEKDLYPVLIKFLWSALKIYSKRIDEKRSSNSSGARTNRWLYPDIVALEDLSEDWHREIKDCVKERSDKKTRLWSFEVKKKISRSNVREYYFQAVSNSSWANFGYLAADEIGNETLRELRILAGLLGVGLIKLDRGHPSGSQIVIPAKERLEVDWSAANRLAKENKDFLNFIKLVREFHQTGRVYAGSWDTKIQRN